MPNNQGQYTDDDLDRPGQFSDKDIDSTAPNLTEAGAAANPPIAKGITPTPLQGKGTREIPGHPLTNPIKRPAGAGGTELNMAEEGAEATPVAAGLAFEPAATLRAIPKGLAGSFVGGKALKAMGAPEWAQDAGSVVGGLVGAGTDIQIPEEINAGGVKVRVPHMIRSMFGDITPAGEIPAASAAVGKSPSNVLPEPAEPIAGQRPGSMFSVKRGAPLEDAAQRGVAGAGDVLKSSGRPIVYTPREGSGYPGPREVTSFGESSPPTQSVGPRVGATASPRPPEDVFVRSPSVSRGASTGEAPAMNLELKADIEKSVGRKLTDEEAMAIDRSRTEQKMATSSSSDIDSDREEHRAKLDKKGRR